LLSGEPLVGDTVKLVEPSEATVPATWSNGDPESLGPGPPGENAQAPAAVPTVAKPTRQIVGIANRLARASPRDRCCPCPAGVDVAESVSESMWSPYVSAISHL
jgi:hypothetical protein